MEYKVQLWNSFDLLARYLFLIGNYLWNCFHSSVISQKLMTLVTEAQFWITFKYVILSKKGTESLLTGIFDTTSKDKTSDLVVEINL